MPPTEDRRYGALRKFVSALVCQNLECGADLFPFQGGVACSESDAHEYPLSGPSGYLILTAEDDRRPTVESVSTDPPYEDPHFALRYAGLWSFSYATVMNPKLGGQGWLVGRGESETFYRTVASIAVQELRGRVPSMIWDIGCGVGRVVHDLAGIYPTATVVGLDRSPAMLEVATRVLTEKGDFTIDLSDVGFGMVSMRRSLVPLRENTLLVQAGVETLALRPDNSWYGADLVLLINVLDRTPDPERLLRVAMSSVAPGGLILVAVSGSWLTSVLWRRYPDAMCFCLDSLTANHFEITFAVENLLLRELVNSRGATVDFPLSIVVARRLQ